ncbi:translocation protein TolB [Thalassoglobus neptunius]|uniref:Translocation protein TolB n=1 Tax=Thalassoglobus neptunius TaxID=1938619 RepID=A0A5C5X622_9PLAN|nr:hypothetical protein [Thalassoglobus neptunius]TWT57781.1 translocation protein TolB [Thalassoglobus neptunius]
MIRRSLMLLTTLCTCSAICFGQESATPEETKYLDNIQRVTFGLPRAGEGYFSPDGQTIAFQAFSVGYPFYQIYVQALDEKTPVRVSPGLGRTTCAYFSPDGESLLFSSAHTNPDIAAIEKEARDLAAAGGYDAEASYSHDGKQIVFTSTRDGDPDLYIMNSDGTNVRQIVNQDGYDGGPFFSPDDNWVLFRSDREEEHMLQLYLVSVDGKTEIQLTDDLQTV